MLCLVGAPLRNGGLDSESECYQQVRSLQNVAVSQNPQGVINGKNEKRRGSWVLTGNMNCLLQ